MVQKGLLQAFSILLDVTQQATLTVTLEGINYVLKCGKENLMQESGSNPFADLAEQCGLTEKIEQL